MCHGHDLCIASTVMILCEAGLGFVACGGDELEGYFGPGQKVG